MNRSTDLEFHYELLELLARRLRPDVYVGFGISSGRCLERVRPYCQRTIGVDLCLSARPAGCELYECSTAEFIANTLPHIGPVELAFIDADHRHEAAWADFAGLLPSMSPEGLILLHDTYPENKRWLDDRLCSDSYRTAAAIARECHVLGVEIVTLPAPPGLSIVRKRGPAPPESFARE